MAGTTSLGLPTHVVGDPIVPIQDILTAISTAANAAIIAQVAPVTPVALTLDAGYGALSGYGAARSHLGRDGFVRLSGGAVRTAATATGVTAFSIGNGALAVAARPVQARGMIVSTYLGPARLSTDSSGTLTVTYQSAQAITQNVWWITFDSASFRLTDA